MLLFLIQLVLLFLIQLVICFSFTRVVVSHSLVICLSFTGDVPLTTLPKRWLCGSAICFSVLYKQEHPRGSIVEPHGVYQDGLNSLKRPQLSLHICTTIYNCKIKEIEIRSSLELVRTLFRITRLTNRKLYLAITGHNSHEKLTKYEIRSSYHLLQFGFIYPH